MPGEVLQKFVTWPSLGLRSRRESGPMTTSSFMRCLETHPTPPGPIQIVLWQRFSLSCSLRTIQRFTEVWVLVHLRIFLGDTVRDTWTSFTLSRWSIVGYERFWIAYGRDRCPSESGIV